MGRRESAGILAHRRGPRGVEVLVAHPGGPFWAGKDEGAWSIPKGELEPGEEPARAAAREFSEETGVRVDPEDLVDLGVVVLPSGKRIHGFAAAIDVDPDRIRSNTFELEWPPGSGVVRRFPEIDRVAWVDPASARRLLHPAQASFVDRLLETLDRAG